MSGYNERGGVDHGHYCRSQGDRDSDSDRNHWGRDGRGQCDNPYNGGVGDYDHWRDDENSHGGYGQYDRGDNGRGNENNNHYGQDRNRDFQGRGSYGRPDRSRSRDRDRGGGRGFNDPPPSTLAAKTNYFKLEIVPTNGQIVEWVQYRVEIICATRVKVFDDDYKFQGCQIIPKLGGKPLDIDKGSELSRRILRKLASDEELPFASDGSCTALSPKELFEHICHTYNVAVKQDCDEDEMDADLVKWSWFKVKFTKVAIFFPTNGNFLEPVRQAIDIILKSAMITVGLKAFGRSPHTFYFPEDLQPEVTSANMTRNQYDFMPMIGIYQTAFFCEDGNAYVNTSTVVDFGNREFKQPMGTKVPIHLLDEKRSTICGIRVDLHNYITDEHTRSEILQKLEKIRINAKFLRPMRYVRLERLQRFSLVQLRTWEENAIPGLLIP